MSKSDQKRIVREYCDSLKRQLLNNCVKRAFREMKRSSQWCALPL